MKKIKHMRYDIFSSDFKKSKNPTDEKQHQDDDNDKEPELITTKEAARLLRMSESWLKNRRWKKQEPIPIKMGGKVFYRKQTVIDMMK